MQSPGSTGALDALAINQIVDKWLEMRGSSAQWQTLWNNRSVIQQNVYSDYPIGYDNDDSSVGWYKYLRDVAKSTIDNGSTDKNQLPHPAWTLFSADIPGLQPDGTTDADMGRRVYALLASTHINSVAYRSHNNFLRWLMCGWAASGSSAIGSS